MTKVGLCGAGFIAPFHLRAWQSANCDVVAIADPDTARAKLRAEKFGIKAVFNSVESMLDGSALDVLDVATPRQFHVEHILAGIDRNLPVIAQKPIAPFLKDAEALGERIPPQARVMVHENWRFRPDYRVIGDWIHSGCLGEVQYVNMEMRSTAMVKDEVGTRPAGLRQPFMLEENRLCIAEVLIHNIDTVRYLIGNLELIDATVWHGDEELPGETAAVLKLRTDFGVPVVISGDMMAAGTPPRATDRVEILATGGRIVLDGSELQINVGRKLHVQSFAERDMLQEATNAAISHFRDCIYDGSPFETSLSDNLNTMRIVEAAYEKAQ